MSKVSSSASSDEAAKTSAPLQKKSHSLGREMAVARLSACIWVARAPTFSKDVGTVPEAAPKKIRGGSRGPPAGIPVYGVWWPLGKGPLHFSEASGATATTRCQFGAAGPKTGTYTGAQDDGNPAPQSRQQTLIDPNRRKQAKKTRIKANLEA